MGSTPYPPIDGEDDRVAESSGGLRLGDAERIAAERLAGVEATHQAAPTEPAPAISDAAATIDAPSPGAHDADEPAPPPEASLEPAPPPAVEGMPPPDASITDGAAELAAAIEPPMHVPAESAAGSPAAAVAPATTTALETSVQPLASALDAAAKLAADANVAAEALENLRRLLQRQLPEIAAGRASASQVAGARTAAPAEPTRPPPLPLHGDGDDAGPGAPEYRPQLATPPAPRALAERVRLDVRGFLAGFALSCAVGVVLYLFMTAG